VKSTNLHLFGNWFIGFTGWSEVNGPYHIWPALVWVKMEDINLSVRGTSLTMLWWNKAFQWQWKKWERMEDDRGHVISDEQMEGILNEMRGRYGWLVDPDAAKIRKVVEKTGWLRQIFANSGEKNTYAIALLSNAIKQPMHHEDLSQKNQKKALGGTEFQF
jgi:hypothetical protein